MWECTVISSRTIAPIIREIVLAPSGDEAFDFTPEAFVQIEAPAYERAFGEFEIAPEHRESWVQQGLGALRAQTAGGVSRAYSIASRAVEDKGYIVLFGPVGAAATGSARAAAGGGVVLAFWLGGGG